MKAIQFNFTIPRYALGLSFGRIYPPLLWSGYSCLMYQDIPQPTIPNEEWVLIKTHYGGICGTDLATINVELSPYYYLPYSSFPHIMGHENVGTIANVGSAVQDFQIGDRVVVEPTLWCAPRGFKDYCYQCKRGVVNLCERFTEGNLSPGLIIGACRDTGGGWGEYFIAHQSQLYKMPDSITDETALMIEPFACALHAVLLEMPRDNETVLILGAGTIGLCTVAALRALGSLAKILVLTRYRFQADAALRLGANQVINAGRHNDYYQEISELVGAKLINSLFGKRVVTGGVDFTYVCVGSQKVFENAIWLTRAGGKITLLSNPGIVKKIDTTPLTTHELKIRASYIYNHAESFRGQLLNTYDLCMKLYMENQLDLGWMVTHKYPINQFAKAFNDLRNRYHNQVIKPAFEFSE